MPGPEQGVESAARIEVLDPDGLWAAPEVECEGAFRVQVLLKQGAPTLEEAVRWALEVRPDDAVRGPWYPGTPVRSSLPGHLVVVRDGRTVATLEVLQSQVSGDICDDAGLAPVP